MKNLKNFPKIAFVFLGLYLGNMAMPYQAQAQDIQVTNAEAAISNYFTVLLSGANTTAAYNAMNAAEQAVTIPADQQTVAAYYNSDSVTTAETAVSNYLKAVLAGNATASLYNIMESAENAVLVQADQQTVAAYYEQTAITTAETAINNYLSAVLAGTATPALYNIMESAENAVLVKADQQTVAAYYEKTAIANAETAVSNYLKAVLAGNATASLYNIMESAENAVLVQADQQTVAVYYEQTAITTAETAINNYFAALLSGNGVSAAQGIMTTAEQAVLVRADQQTVTNYYNHQQILYLYQYALKMIGLYSVTPNSTTLATALTAVIALQPDNNILALSGLGLYDDALNQLMQAVSTHLSNTNNVSSIKTPADVDGSFGTGVAVDTTGDVFISAPSNASNGKGIIYEFSETNNQWTEINHFSSSVAGDHFGRVISVNGSTLAASSEPANGLARVYIFNLQNNTQTYINLTTEADVKSIQLIDLASSFNTIVVGLPFQGRYLIFNHVFDYSTATDRLVSDQWSLVFLGTLSGIISVAADGFYIGIGSNQLGSNGTPTGSVQILEGSIQTVRVNSGFTVENEYSMNWTIDTQVKGFNSFGQSISLYQNPPLALPIGNPTLSIIPIQVINTVTVAIGSPLENNGAGAVYTMVKGTNPTTKKFSWSTLSSIQLVMPSWVAAAGNEVVLNGSALMVSANSTKATASSIVTVYQLSSNNQWTWGYAMSNSNPSFGSSLAINALTNGQIEAIGSPKAVNDNNSADISQVEVISPK